MKSWILSLLIFPYILSADHPIYCGPQVQQFAPLTCVDLDLDFSPYPRIEANLCGRKVQFFLNSSLEATPLSLDRKVLDELGWPFSGVFSTFCDSEGNIHEAEEFFCYEFTLDCWNFYNKIGLIHEEGNEWYEGILGTRFFDPFTILIDYPQRRFVVSDGPELLMSYGYRVADWATVDLIEENGVHYIEILVNGEPMKAHLSTGSSHNVVKVCEVPSPVEISVGGVELGLYDTCSHPFVEPSEVDMLLGDPFFYRRPVCIDYAHKKVYVGKELVE